MVSEELVREIHNMTISLPINLFQILEFSPA